MERRRTLWKAVDAAEAVGERGNRTMENEELNKEMRRRKSTGKAQEKHEKCRKRRNAERRSCSAQKGTGWYVVGVRDCRPVVRWVCRDPRESPPVVARLLLGVVMGDCGCRRGTQDVGCRTGGEGQREDAGLQMQETEKGGASTTDNDRKLIP